MWLGTNTLVPGAEAGPGVEEAGAGCGGWAWPSDRREDKAWEGKTQEGLAQQGEHCPKGGQGSGGARRGRGEDKRPFPKWGAGGRSHQPT